MPSDFAFKTMNTVHRALLKVSGGRVGWSAGKMPALELTTTGRRTGQPRRTMLTSPWREGDKLAVVASAGGNDGHPAWYLNIEANPEVTVRTDGKEVAMVARIVEGDERTELWEQITSSQKRYADYQSKTDREIPIVVLEPAS